MSACLSARRPRGNCVADLVVGAAGAAWPRRRGWVRGGDRVRAARPGRAGGALLEDAPWTPLPDAVVGGQRLTPGLSDVAVGGALSSDP